MSMQRSVSAPPATVRVAVVPHPANVQCSNAACKGRNPLDLKPRYIGTDGGAGGSWQCKACGKWTER